MHALLLLCLALGPNWDDARLRERFDREFAPALARNREFYSQLSGSGTLSRFVTVALTREERKDQSLKSRLRAGSDQTGGALVESHAFSFAVQGPLKKITMRTLVKQKQAYRDPETGQVAAKENPAPAGPFVDYEVSRCIGSGTSFRAVRKSEGGPLTLTTKEAGLDREMTGRFEVEFGNHLAPIYNLWNTREERFYPNPPFKVKSVTPRVKDGLELAHVEFEIEYPKDSARKGPDYRFTRGWFDAIPDRGWVIREQVLDSPAIPEIAAVKIEYEGSQDGLPLPKSVAHYTGVGRTIAEFDQIRHGPVPESEFTLAAFGLPEVAPTLAPPSPNRMAYWLIGIGVLILVAVIGFRIDAGRRSSRRVAGQG